MGSGGHSGPSEAQVQAKTEAAYYKGKCETLSEEFQKQNNALRQELQETKDPKQMVIKIQEIKESFWDYFKKQKFELNPGKSVIFIGRTSVGKSSLLNTLFKTKLATSKMSCTKQISVVTKIGNVTIFDCPGLDEHFDLIKEPEKIPKYLGCMEHICYLYDGYIEEDVVKTFMVMNKKIYAVRTKCDPDQTPEENDTVKSSDLAQLKKIGCDSIVFLTSKKGGVDNQELLKQIIS